MYTQPRERTSTSALGHVVYSPPICFGVGIAEYTEDFAIIKIDADKVDRTWFTGNVIDLGGTDVSTYGFEKTVHTNSTGPTSFEHSLDGLLTLL